MANPLMRLRESAYGRIHIFLRHVHAQTASFFLRLSKGRRNRNVHRVNVRKSERTKFYGYIFYAALYAFYISSMDVATRTIFTVKR
jgi:hypothetical protein